MRDSPLKRTLVSALFSAAEVRRALSQAFTPARFAGQAIDYDAYWTQRAPGSMQPRFHIIADGIAAGARVLDVGCGDGTLLQHLAAVRQVAGVGLDISAPAVARARARGIDARLGGLETTGVLAVHETFQHVVMSEVIEHVADAEGFVRRAWSLSGETLWLTFPNIAYFPHRLRLVAGRFPVQWVVFPGEHLRFWSVPDFVEWLGGLDLPAPRLIPSNGFTFGALHRAWPNLFANQIVVRIDRART